MRRWKPSKAWARPSIRTPCRWLGWPMAAPSAVSAARLHRFLQGAPGPEPQPLPRGGARLVPETPQRLPLHRLPSAGGRGHGRGQGAARRNALEDIAYKLPDDGQIWGTNYPRAHGSGQGDRHLGLRRDLGLKLPPDDPASGPGSGHVSHANHQVHRHQPKRKACPAWSRW
jgi:hypothetical protein